MSRAADLHPGQDPVGFRGSDPDSFFCKVDKNLATMFGFFIYDIKK